MNNEPGPKQGEEGKVNFITNFEDLFSKFSSFNSWDFWRERKKHFQCTSCQNKAYGVSTVYLNANCYCGGKYQAVDSIKKPAEKTYTAPLPSPDLHPEGG